MTDPTPLYTQTLADCACDDTEAGEVASLMLTGLTQREASLVVWGEPVDVSPAAWSAWAARTVRVAFAELRERWAA